MSNVSLIDGHIDEPKKCEFCERFDFATARAEVYGDWAHIDLAICNTRFPKEEQFKYCPVCGRELESEVTDNV